MHAWKWIASRHYQNSISKLNTDMNAVADYVVERGWAGDFNSWFYTKWDSGYIEIESTRDLDGTSGWTAYGKTSGGNTTVNIGIWGKQFIFNLPSGLLSGAPTSCQLTCDWDCYGVSDNMPNWTATSFGIMVFSGGGYGVDELLRINIKLGGRWK